MASGKILRMNADGSGLEVFAQPGGRILGLAFDAAGHITGADAKRGLVSVSPDGKTTTVLADTVDGDPIRFADAVVVARNGRIYFSDATTRFSVKALGVDEASLLEIVEGAASGRVLELWPIPKDRAHVFAFTEDGKVVEDLQDPSGAYGETTGVTELADRLIVTNLHAGTLGWVARAAQ